MCCFQRPLLSITHLPVLGAAPAPALPQPKPKRPTARSAARSCHGAASRAPASPHRFPCAPMQRAQKANRSCNTKPVPSTVRRKVKKSESGGEGEGEEAGEDGAHEALAAMMAAQVGLGSAGAVPRGLLHWLLHRIGCWLDAMLHRLDGWRCIASAGLALGRRFVAEQRGERYSSCCQRASHTPPCDRPLLVLLQRPPSSRLAAKRRFGSKGDSDYEGGHPPCLPHTQSSFAVLHHVGACVSIWPRARCSEAVCCVTPCINDPPCRPSPRCVS